MQGRTMGSVPAPRYCCCLEGPDLRYRAELMLRRALDKSTCTSHEIIVRPFEGRKGREGERE